MGVLDKTSRPPSYVSDIETYGGNGEKLFLTLESEKFSSRGSVIFDVTKEREYQLKDIDFVVSVKDIDMLPPIDEVLNDNDFIKIEVKVDTRALQTGNLPYEVISHGSLGWSVITKSDYVYMILCSEGNGDIIAEKILWIDMNKWHYLASNRKVFKRINEIRNEKIVDLLCKISDMRDNGVIMKEKDVSIKINNDDK